MDARIARAREGIAQLELPDEVVEGALANLQRWLVEPAFAAYVPQIEGLIDAGRFDVLADAFYRVVPFGTGGRRGAMGVGPNRINSWTIGTSVQGHVDWLRARYGDAEDLRVVVGYDVRRFEDVEHVWDPELPNPVLGLSSRDLAELAVRIYAANGVEAALLPRDAERYLSTPELSFTIRQLRAHGGVNISASHNPPDDNGIKVYDERGAQLVPPLDGELMQAVETVESVRVLEWEDAVESGKVRLLGPSVHRAWVETVAALAAPGPREVGLLYTPLHGTGLVHEVLREAGYRCEVLAEQCTPDARFSTVPGLVANPERPEALKLAMERAGDGIDLILATDPDADRVGAACRHQGRWVHLSGNDIGVLVAHQVLSRTWKRRPLVLTTEVTSSLVDTVARAGGAEVVGDLLVGFKYIAEALRILEEEGSYRGIRADEVEFAAGIEESNGCLLTTAMRDKCGAGGALLLAEAAAVARARGRTLIDVLDQLKEEHGYVVNAQLNVRFPGASGQAGMQRLLGGLRDTPPTALCGRPVVRFADHRDPTGRFGPIRSETDAASRNVLVFTLGSGPYDDGARVVLRPSGTEPKLKVYVELCGHPGLKAAQRAEIDAELARFVECLGPALTA